jgi:hypothetical protein
MALDLNDTAKANAALTTSIESASRIITNLIGTEGFNMQLLRSAPAVVDLHAAQPDLPDAPPERQNP